MRARPEPTVPCNNDLLAENFIDVGGAFRLIDYEYSGNNDACFELGNVWSESNLSLAQLEQLVAEYYGRPLRNKVARCRVWGLMSKYGWTLWASIQDGVSTVDFDFIAAGQDWAVDVALSAGLALSPNGAIFVRGELGPLAPYLPNGAYL